MNPSKPEKQDSKDLKAHVALVSLGLLSAWVRRGRDSGSYCFVILALLLVLLSVRLPVTAIVFLTLRISIGFFLFRITAFVRNVVFLLLYCSFLQGKSRNKSSEHHSQ